MGPGGGYGMGPGMMGGYGDGMGMGGYGDGMGPWMMGSLALRALGLTAAQEAQVNKISDELRRKNWDLLGKMQDEGAKLRDLYGADKLDRSAITAAYKRLGDLRQARIENALEAQEKIDAVLTPDQRKELRSRGYGWRGQ
jgi:Spy/CpxP family protein refolding chaperone